MPTVPAEPPRPTQHEPHRYREVAESFGVDAERYDRTRPGYPDALVDRIVAGGRDLAVLDVGCGTGIVARQFQSAGALVLGVDVDARMADLARRRGLEVDVATFEAWEPEGRTFDAVVAGQTWHWVDPVAGAAKAARVLRPGGRLALFWNAAQPPAEVNDAFASAFQRVLPDSPVKPGAMPDALDAYRMLGAKAADGIRETGAFSDPEEWLFGQDATYTRDAWLDQLPTFGPLTRLPRDDMAEVLAAVGTAIDGMGGSFTMHVPTVVVTATRAGAA